MPPLLLRTKALTGKPGCTIVVSKKIDKRATRRNRMKRLIRESLRRLFPENIRGTIIVKQDISGYSQQEVEGMVRELIHEKPNT